VFDAESWPYVAIRWIGYTTLLLIIGIGVFRSVVLRAGARLGASGTQVVELAELRAAQFGSVATAVLLASCVARLLAQVAAMFGVEYVTDLSQAFTLVTETTWGRGWIFQVLVAVLAFAAFEMVRRHASRRPDRWWWTSTAAALLLAFTPATAGHAMAVAGRTGLAVVSDGLHVLAAGAWIGTLAMLVLVGVPAADRAYPEEYWYIVQELVGRFSPVAIGAATLIAATGAYAACLHVGQVPALWQSPYGRTLVVKLSALGLVAGLGAYNFLRIRPALDNASTVRNLRVATALELAFAMLLLLITAVLVATPTAREGQSATALSTSIAFAGSLPA
jgi:putative copper export protein